MKRRNICMVMAVTLAVASASPAFAAWEQQDATWKYRQEDQSYAANKWLEVNGLWYYFDAEGVMQTGWKEIKNKWYYLDDTTGYMRTGWLEKNGKWYYFDDASGKMLTNKRTPDGYYVNKEGIYDETKGNSLKKGSVVGPGEKIVAEQKNSLLKGVLFPVLDNFASASLSDNSWGSQEGINAMLELGSVIQGELGEAVNPVQIDENSVTFSTGNPATVKLKLVKAGDHYELYDYGQITDSMGSILYGMLSLISSTPQNVYNAIYTASEYDQTIMRDDYYTIFGDSKVYYTIGDGFVIFNIAAN